jgi:hypothetical protein
VSFAAAAIAVALCSAGQILPSFSANVEVGHVDVFVSRGNEAVRGLSSADFQAFDDGVLQKVEVVSQDEARSAQMTMTQWPSGSAGPRPARRAYPSSRWTIRGACMRKMEIQTQILK